MKIRVDNRGLKNLEKRLDKATNALNGKHSFEEMFPPSFMRKYTNYTNIVDFFDDCGFPYETKEQFEAIPDKEFDSYVNRVTNFKSWEDMMKSGATDLFIRNFK